MFADIPTDVLAEIAEDDAAIAGWLNYVADDGFYESFVPRPDDPANFDQQHSFCFNRDQVSFLVGGNASGTTSSAAFKTARFLLSQPPPRKDTPFWIIGNNYDQVCDVCWKEKLIGEGHLPDSEIDWDRIVWLSVRSGRPSLVPLKPWPESRGGDPDKNWRLEFKSYEQQRQAMQGKSIGGFWFSEQFPLDIFLEVLRGCREYMFPGGQFAEFTPVEPELSIWVEKAMDDPPTGWEFYRCNTEKNLANLQDGWFEQFFALVPVELRDTRMTGALATFEGVIYPSFLRAVHVIDERMVVIPPGAIHALGTDWGASAEHPHATEFGCRDAMGNWLIYDEYWCADQRITEEHVAEVFEKAVAWGWPVETDGQRKPLRRLKYNALRHTNYADPSRPDQVNEFTKRGVASTRAFNKVYEGINCIRAALKCHPATGEPGLLISSKCVHLIEEMRKYRWRRGRRPEQGNILNPKVATPEPLKRDDDTVDALRYLIFSEAMGRGETIHSTSKSQTPHDRRSVQLQRQQIERMTAGIGQLIPGVIGGGSHRNGNDNGRNGHNGRNGK